MAMYTITVALLCAAFELQNSISFLLPYIILFSFQNTITSKYENIIVIAAYISVCLEEGRGWESYGLDAKRTMHKGAPFKRPRSIKSRIMGRIGSVQLGMLNSVFCCLYAVRELFYVVQLNEVIKPVFCIVLSIIMYILIRVQTRDVLKLGKRRELYIENLRNSKEHNNPNETVIV